MTRSGRRSALQAWIATGVLLAGLLLASALSATAVDKATNGCTELVQSGQTTNPWRNWRRWTTRILSAFGTRS
ncbi:MAG: hypothetical protein ACUVR4_11625 [Anaerolineae bacterium]